MRRVLALALLVLSALTACAPHEFSAPQVSAPQVTFEIGDVSNEFPYVSEPEPSGIRGLSVGDLIQDAWTVAPATANSATWAFVPSYSASYDGLPDMSGYDATYFPVASIKFPGVYHVFNMVASARV